jgi:hypothetical protein
MTELKVLRVLKVSRERPAQPVLKVPRAILLC